MGGIHEDLPHEFECIPSCLYHSFDCVDNRRIIFNVIPRFIQRVHRVFLAIYVLLMVLNEPHTNEDKVKIKLIIQFINSPGYEPGRATDHVCNGHAGSYLGAAGHGTVNIFR